MNLNELLQLGLFVVSVMIVGVLLHYIIKWSYRDGWGWILAGYFSLQICIVAVREDTLEKYNESFGWILGGVILMFVIVIIGMSGEPKRPGCGKIKQGDYEPRNQ